MTYKIKSSDAIFFMKIFFLMNKAVTCTIIYGLQNFADVHSVCRSAEIMHGCKQWKITTQKKKKLGKCLCQFENVISVCNLMMFNRNTSHPHSLLLVHMKQSFLVSWVTSTWPHFIQTWRRFMKESDLVKQ